MSDKHNASQVSIDLMRKADLPEILAIEREFRRQNLAFNLLKTMEEIAKQIGIKAQTLEVRQSNKAAIKLYEKLGFVVKGRRPNYYTDTKEDAIIMWANVKPR